MFKKYASITNHYDEKFLSHVREHEGSKGPWCVTEKIHGANFSFWMEKGDESFRIAKRTSLIADDDKFCGCRSVVERYGEKIKSLFEYMFEYNMAVEDACEIKTVALCGELFGGSYPGIKSQRKSIQKGVHYTDDVEFFAFDIMVNGQYIDVHLFRILCSLYDIKTAPFLKYGSLDECLDFDVNINSVIPNLCGMEKLDENIIEGVVIATLSVFFLDNGSRAIIKHKTAAFLEKSSVKKPHKIINVTEEVKVCAEEISRYITDARYDNVISHCITEEMSNISNIAKEFSSDLFNEFNNETDMLTNLSDEEQKMVRKKVSALIFPFLKKKIFSL